MDKPPKLMDQVRTRMRYKQYALSTERAYCFWIRRYILFPGKKHPKHLGAEDVAFAPAKGMTAGFVPIGAVCYAADSFSIFHPGNTSTAG